MERKNTYTLHEVAEFKFEISNKIKRDKVELKTKMKNLYLFIGFLFFCLISFCWSSLLILIPILTISVLAIILLTVKIVKIKNNLMFFEATLSIPPDEF